MPVRCSSSKREEVVFGIGKRTCTGGFDHRSRIVVGMIRAVAVDEHIDRIRKVAEGAEIPETVVKLKDNLVKMVKRGRMLVASYEGSLFAPLTRISNRLSWRWKASIPARSVPA